MRISVECGGFDRAADAARTANQIAAILSDTLSGKLAGLAGMAGNDSTSVDFARAYDDAAGEAVATVADLTHALIGLGRLLAATGDHHVRAESAAAGQVLASVSSGLTSDAYVRVSPSPPPSSLGGQEPSFGRVDRWILDHVEGFVWPSGDVALLRDAATAWRRAAESVAGLTDHVRSARDLLEAQVSAEVPVVLACLDDVDDLVRATADELTALATACEDHAAAVESVHERTRALLSEVASMAVEGVAISAIVSAASGPLGGLAVGAALRRIAEVGARFRALVAALRLSVASSSTRLRAGHEALLALRTRLGRYARTRVRDERGSIRLLGDGRWRRGWLSDHEVPPGHTLARHVGKTVEELAERCRAGRPRRASSFDDQESAERLLGDALRKRSNDIEAWLRGNGGDRLTLTEDLGIRTGTSVRADGVVTDPTGVRAVLIRDASQPSGWRILTAFPN